jgi:predicted secreted protein
MIQDGRSGKVILLSHCILNMNAVCEGSTTPSHHPAIVNEILDLIQAHQTGVIQLPCPEQEMYGLDRKARTKEFYDNEEFRLHCHALAVKVVQQIEEYERKGYGVVGFIGRMGSPTCNVEGNPGIFVEELSKELQVRGLKLRMLSFDWRKISECLLELRKTLSQR